MPPTGGESAWRSIDPRSARLEGGVLILSNTRERPVWWSSSLRENATIELDVRLEAPLDEVAVEAWADGQSPGTGYRFVLAGPGGTSGISRPGAPPVGGADSAGYAVPGESHHWKIVRGGNELAWLIDGKPFAGVADPAPLAGPGHAALGIEAGTTPVRITDCVFSDSGAGRNFQRHFRSPTIPMREVGSYELKGVTQPQTVYEPP